MPRTFKYRGELVSLTALMVCTFSSIGGFIFGYDIGYLAGCLEMPYFQAAYGTSYPDGTAHASRQAITTSILSVGSFTGALLGVPIADYVGRRLSILTSAVVFIIGVVVQVAPVRIWGGLLAGRFIAGMGVGALSALVPLYLGEVSPKALRGGFTSLYQVSITLGILLAYILTYATHRIPSDASYQIPIAIQCLWGLILAVGCPFLPASPRESVLKGDLDASRKTVASMHGVALHHPLVEYTVREIESKLEEEKASGSGYLDCFNFKNDIQTGKRTLIGMTVQAFQQLTGANFIFYYGTTVFTTLSIDSYVSQIIFGAISSVSTLLGLFCLDYFGRRRTMITGAIVMGLAYLMYAVLGSYALYPNNDTSAEPRTSVGGVIVFFICIFSLAYGGSFGPGGWVNTGEIAPLRTKAKQLSFVAASNWTFNTLISALSPIITASIGAKYGFVFLVTNFMAAAFIYFCVPEMSGLSLEEINLLFQERVSPRKSFKWNKEQRAKKHSYDGETEITDVSPDVEVANLKTAEKPKAPAPPQHLESGDSGATRV